MDSFDYKIVKRDNETLTVDITVPSNQIDELISTVCAVLSRNFNVQGCTLAQIKKALVGKKDADELDKLCRSFVMNKVLSSFLKQEDIRPIIAPGIHSDNFPRDGMPFGFQMHITIGLGLKLSSCEPVQVVFEKTIISDDEVEAEMNAHRNEHAKFEILDPRPIEQGDFAILDSTMFINGKLVDAFSGPNQRYCIDYGSMPDEFISNIIGMNIGEKKDFFFEAKQKDAFGVEKEQSDKFKFTVTVKTLLGKTLPTITDKWVQTYYPDFHNVEGYRSACRKKLEMNLALDESKTISALACTELAKRLQGNIPDELYTSVYKSMMNKIWNEIDSKGITMDEYLAVRKISENELNMNVLMRAGESIRQNYALDLLFSERGMKLTDGDVDKALDAIAFANNIPLQKVLSNPNMLKIAEESARRKIALKWLIETAIIIASIE